MQLQKELTIKSRRLCDLENQLLQRQAEKDRLAVENERLQKQLKAQSQALMAAQSQARSGTPAAAATPKGPLSRQGSDGSDSSAADTLKASLAAKEKEAAELRTEVERLKAAAVTALRPGSAFGGRTTAETTAPGTDGELHGPCCLLTDCVTTLAHAHPGRPPPPCHPPTQPAASRLCAASATRGAHAVRA